MSKLRKELDNVLNKYIKKFEEKHGCRFEFAVKDDLMDVLHFGDIFYFSASDVVFDIDNDLPKRMIFDWLDENMDHKDHYINLYSYSKGARYNAVPVKSNLKAPF